MWLQRMQHFFFLMFKVKWDDNWLKKGGRGRKKRGSWVLIRAGERPEGWDRPAQVSWPHPHWGTHREQKNKCVLCSPDRNPSLFLYILPPRENLINWISAAFSSASESESCCDVWLRAEFSGISIVAIDNLWNPEALQKGWSFFWGG